MKDIFEETILVVYCKITNGGWMVLQIPFADIVMFERLKDELLMMDEIHHFESL